MGAHKHFAIIGNRSCHANTIRYGHKLVHVRTGYASFIQERFAYRRTHTAITGDDNRFVRGRSADDFSSTKLSRHD
jgi:hypothetical protein